MEETVWMYDSQKVRYALVWIEPEAGGRDGGEPNPEPGRRSWRAEGSAPGEAEAVAA